MNPIDKSTMDDIYQVSEFCDHITRLMLATERLTQPNSTYMDSQKDIKEDTRAILIDWIIKTHDKLKYWPETLFLTVNLIDRYLSIF